MINNNHVVDSKQLWQQVEPFLTASGATSVMTTQEDGKGRYIYYLSGSSFVKYDTIANSSQKLASPLVAPVSFASLRYSAFGGTWCRVISSPTANSVRVAGIAEHLMNGALIRIVQGAGAGQIRTVTATGAPVKYDQGVATVASASSIGDSTKKWKINQWAGYQVRITYGTGLTQVRRISYNDTTTLYVADANYQPLYSFDNFNFTITPSIVAGSQSHFVIEACDCTVDTPWTVQPDYTSVCKIETGGCWLLSSSASAPFFTLQYYDTVMDCWMNKTVPTGFVLSAFSTDGTIERTGEIGGIYDNGTATGGATYTITDTTKTWGVGQYTNYRIRISGGTGIGQQRRIVHNGVNFLEVARKWQITPDATTTYEIVADKDKLYIGGNLNSFLMQYDVDSDLVIQGAKFDDGIASNLSANFVGIDTPTIALSTGTRTANGIKTVTSTPVAGGTNYLVGDILTLSTTGTNGKVIVTSTNVGGVITGVALMRSGSGYAVGTSATTGGTGTGATIAIATIGVVCNAVTAINHNFKIGDSVVISGDALYAGTVTIIGCDSLTNFDFATTATGNLTALASNSATVIVDASKNWTVNEHVGKILQTHLVGLTGAVQSRMILSNTATTITVATITTPLVSGNGRYAIVAPSMFGRDEQYKDIAKSNYGVATSGTTTTLVDNTKTWNTNQWVGGKMRIMAGLGRDVVVTIVSNTLNTITYTTQSFTPDATTKYIIQDSFGICTSAGATTTIIDSTKVWAVNQWAGKRVRITAGTGLGNEVTIASNTSNTLTVSAMSVASDVTTVYTILSIPVRGAGIELIWAFGGVSNGKYLFYPRGGASNNIDRYDITTETYEYSICLNPQTDTMTGGTYYAYDGGNRIYFSPAVSSGQVQYVHYWDLTKGKVFSIGSVPNTQGANVVGNRMEIVTSDSGISYLYHMRNSSFEMYRTMLWF